jgi:broad specificity phosphatase PhoE
VFRNLTTVTTIVVALGLGVAAVAPFASAAEAPGDSSLTTVIFVRHAERNDKFLGSDPPLSAAGAARAQALARVLGETHVAAIYVTEFARTRQTAEPLAKLIGDSLRVLRGEDFAAQARRIRSETQGRTALVVGHSNTVPQLIQALTGTAVDFGHNRFDLLYVAFLYPGGSKQLRIDYGAASDSLASVPSPK